MTDHRTSDHGTDPPYDDIPGTYVFDARRSRMGYRLNEFLMSLNVAENRDAFRADESAYLDRFGVTADQRTAVLQRDWLGLLEVGGNIYYVYKLAAADGMTFQQLASLQTGLTEDEYVEMMVAGGRPVDGNRSRADHEPGAARGDG